MKGFAEVTDPICLGESFVARVRNAVRVWFYRTTDERAKAHHSQFLHPKKKKGANQFENHTRQSHVVVCCGVLWCVVVRCGVAHVNKAVTQRFSNRCPCRRAPGKCPKTS